MSHSPQHGVPRGEKSSYGQANGSPGTEGFKGGRHRAENGGQSTAETIEKAKEERK